IFWPRPWIICNNKCRRDLDRARGKIFSYPILFWDKSNFRKKWSNKDKGVQKTGKMGKRENRESRTRALPERRGNLNPAKMVKEEMMKTEPDRNTARAPMKQSSKKSMTSIRNNKNSGNNWSNNCKI